MLLLLLVITSLLVGTSFPGKTFILINNQVIITSWDRHSPDKTSRSKQLQISFFSNSNYLKFNNMNTFYDFWSFVSSIVNCFFNQVKPQWHISSEHLYTCGISNYSYVLEPKVSLPKISDFNMPDSNLIIIEMPREENYSLQKPRTRGSALEGGARRVWLQSYPITRPPTVFEG